MLGENMKSKLSLIAVCLFITANTLARDPKCILKSFPSLNKSYENDLTPSDDSKFTQDSYISETLFLCIELANIKASSDVELLRKTKVSAQGSIVSYIYLNSRGVKEGDGLIRVMK